MNKKFIIGFGFAILFFLMFIFLRIGFDLQGEDSWIRDLRGVYIRHGNLSTIPNYVAEQQDALNCTNELYNQKKSEGMEFNSQCLGTCSDFAVDVVHVPRNSDDDLAQNECEDFTNGKLKHFIELDKEENIVRVV